MTRQRRQSSTWVTKKLSSQLRPSMTKIRKTQLSASLRSVESISSIGQITKSPTFDLWSRLILSRRTLCMSRSVKLSTRSSWALTLGLVACMCSWVWSSLSSQLNCLMETMLHRTLKAWLYLNLVIAMKTSICHLSKKRAVQWTKKMGTLMRQLIRVQKILIHLAWVRILLITVKKMPQSLATPIL